MSRLDLYPPSDFVGLGMCLDHVGSGLGVEVQKQVGSAQDNTLVEAGFTYTRELGRARQLTDEGTTTLSTHTRGTSVASAPALRGQGPWGKLARTTPQQQR